MEEKRGGIEEEEEKSVDQDPYASLIRPKESRKGKDPIEKARTSNEEEEESERQIEKEAKPEDRHHAPSDERIQKNDSKTGKGDQCRNTELPIIGASAPIAFESEIKKGKEDRSHQEPSDESGDPRGHIDPFDAGLGDHDPGQLIQGEVGSEKIEVKRKGT